MISRSKSLSDPNSGADNSVPEKSTRASRRAARRAERVGTVKVKKYGFLGAFLRPIGISIALLLAGWGAISMGTTFWRSYERHALHTKAVHEDESIFDIFVKSDLPKDAVKLVIKDVDGKLRRVAASGSQTDAFVNSTILMLDGERDRIKIAASEDIDRLFDHAFADREQILEAYADWFFEWKRSYVVLKETITSATNRFIQTGEYESLSEAVERDVKDYFLRHYMSQVLKPALRDEMITQEIETTVRRAHESYRRVVANGDMRLQLFMAQYTQHLNDVPSSASLTDLKLDWDAQKWKAPTYLMEDKAFEGVIGLGHIAAGGTIGALALGPVMTRVVSGTFGMLSRRFVTSIGTRLVLAEKGVVAGTLIQPAGGQIVGAIAGVVLGVAADYFINEAYEEFDREKFINANRDALDTTIAVWKAKLAANVTTAVDRWFDDTRSSVVLAQDS